MVDAVLARRLRRVGDDVRKTLATEVDRLAREVQRRHRTSKPQHPDSPSVKSVKEEHTSNQNQLLFLFR